jgi:hypothetical protein
MAKIASSNRYLGIELVHSSDFPVHVFPSRCGVTMRREGGHLGGKTEVKPSIEKCQHHKYDHN